MSLEQFLEQLRVVGVIGAYTTATLFLCWAVWQGWVLWLDLHTKISREKAESWHEEFERTRARDAEMEYKKKHGHRVSEFYSYINNK